jgi:hypothetical protein
MSRLDEIASIVEADDPEWRYHVKPIKELRPQWQHDVKGDARGRKPQGLYVDDVFFRSAKLAAEAFDVHMDTVHSWLRMGHVTGNRVNAGATVSRTPKRDRGSA